MLPLLKRYTFLVWVPCSAIIIFILYQTGTYEYFIDHFGPQEPYIPPIVEDPYPKPYPPSPGFAQRISASDLLARPLPVKRTAIPKILHTSWKSSLLSGKLEAWNLSCRQQHSDWEWVLWTDQDNLNLVRKYYPWLEESYKALPAEIYRADLVRTLYLHAFGGLYTDLDTECLRPSTVVFDEYLPEWKRPTQTVFFGRMGKDPTNEHSVPNAWMAGTPAHPMLLVLPMTVNERVKARKIRGVIPEYLTGPVALRESILLYEKMKISNGNTLGKDIVELGELVPFLEHDPLDHQVVLLPSEIVFPYSHAPDGEPYRPVCWVVYDTYDPDLCKQELQVAEKGSICISYWSHTHSPKGANTKNTKNVQQ